MKCDELKPIELECNMGKDINGVEHREPWKAYDIDEVDAAIAELKQKLDKAIADKDSEIAQLQAMLEERNKQVRELKDRIAPKQSDKTLQERLNEVCEKHGVSTLQDLDWAFCESEKRHTKDNIDAAKIIEHYKYKRCLDMVAHCDLKMSYWAIREIHEGDTGKFELYSKWHERWLELAEKFKPNT